MNNSIKFILIGVILLVIQLITDEYINVFPILHIVVFPLLIIIIPDRVKPVPLMLIAFFYGLLIDATSDGVIGLNASALVAMAFFKQPLLYTLLNKNSLAEMPVISGKYIKMLLYICYCALLYSLFFLVYILLDGLTTDDIFYSLIRFAIGVVTNLLIAIFLEKLLSQQF
jgi:hypothetical protein